MTGKRYYITTLGAWQRHATRFITSHFIALDSRAVNHVVIPNRAAVFADCGEGSAVAASSAELLPGTTVPDNATPILVLVEGDEGAHLALEDAAAFEALPHPLAQKPISQAARTALASHGIPYGATTFDVAEAVSRVHPLLRHRVF